MGFSPQRFLSGFFPQSKQESEIRCKRRSQLLRKGSKNGWWVRTNRSETSLSQSQAPESTAPPAIRSNTTASFYCDVSENVTPETHDIFYPPVIPHRARHHSAPSAHSDGWTSTTSVYILPTNSHFTGYSRDSNSHRQPVDKWHLYELLEPRNLSFEEEDMVPKSLERKVSWARFQALREVLDSVPIHAEVDTPAASLTPVDLPGTLFSPEPASPLPEHEWNSFSEEDDKVVIPVRIGAAPYTNYEERSGRNRSLSSSTAQHPLLRLTQESLVLSVPTRSTDTITHVRGPALTDTTTTLIAWAPPVTNSTAPADLSTLDVIEAYGELASSHTTSRQTTPERQGGFFGTFDVDKEAHSTSLPHTSVPEPENAPHRALTHTPSLDIDVFTKIFERNNLSLHSEVYKPLPALPYPQNVPYRGHTFPSRSGTTQLQVRFEVLESPSRANGRKTNPFREVVDTLKQPFALRKRG
ncbi:hypothetical protein BJ742DRAFT_877414 [Cladochytrium replicatum]|nr:hypothetical protein BJ742DRAFT_877414 [Cladochytrium replicatum]